MHFQKCYFIILKTQELLKRTGYPLDVTVGQRKFGGPPPDWTPESGKSKYEVCLVQKTLNKDASFNREVLRYITFQLYIARAPADCFEDELEPLLAVHGKIWDMRIMMDMHATGGSKGFLFVSYCTNEDAKKAAKEVCLYH